MSKLQITVQEEEGISIVEIAGDLDAHTAMQLETVLENLVKENKYNIIANCRDLRHISSAGLGVFMAVIEMVRKNQGDIKLSNIPRRIQQVFDVSGFSTLFQIFDDVTEAREKFRESQ